MEQNKTLQTLVYLFTGADYRLVGLLQEETCKPYNPAKGLHAKIDDIARNYWGDFPGIEYLFGEEVAKKRNLRWKVSQSPKEFADGLRILFKLGVKILLPKDCKVFKAELRRELEKMGFEMRYHFESGALVESASYTLETIQGWANYFTSLAKSRGIESVIGPSDEFQFSDIPVFKKVTWNTTVTTLEDARAIHQWATESEADSNLHIAEVEWGTAKYTNAPRPLIVKIPQGMRTLICFMTANCLKRSNRNREDIAGKQWKIRITKPTGDQKAGKFELLQEIS